MAEDTKQQDNQLQPEAQSSNRRIAKNALMLYIRMFLTMIVGLYTSRVVLATLGVEDYGIYGVVGGVVAMMGFLNASMSGATSRFLTFELGRGDQKRLADTFSSALIVHIGIALVVFVLAETIGLWFLCNKLVIPAGRMAAAHWVYQCSILSAMFGITQAPYNASIIAHEKMDVYAYVEILHVTLKLAIVYLLVIGNFDKLKLYAILMLLVSAIIIIVYRVYCIHRFEECRFHWIWDKSILKPLVSFSGWDLYGNLSLTARSQGRNFLINIFFGVIYNAANGISTTVTGILSGLAGNVLIAFKPQIIKSYAKHSMKDFNQLLVRSTKISTLFALIACVPICFQIKYVLGLWLTVIPEGTDRFVVLSLISWCFIMMFSSVNIGNQATGKIKGLSITIGTLHILNIPFVWIAFEFGLNVEYAYIISIITNFIIVLVNLYYIKLNIPSISIPQFITNSILPVILTTVVLIACCIIIRFLFMRQMQLLQIVLNILMSILLSYYIGLTKDERHMIIVLFKNKFCL